MIRLNRKSRKLINFFIEMASYMIICGIAVLVFEVAEPEQELPMVELIEEIEEEIEETETETIIEREIRGPRVSNDLINMFTGITIYYTTLETEYCCRGYITAYCAEECGWNYSTSSGAICHYSDDWMEPTTCAIDRQYFNYGELFMIDGRLYVAEDTGSAVKGLHWDLYYESMDEVRSFGSHYTDVYIAWFEEHSMVTGGRLENLNYYLQDFASRK